MGLEGVDRVHLKLREEFKKLIKIEISFPHGKMFIHLSVIIVEMNLRQVLAEGFDPEGKRDLAEDMMMAGVETESKMG